MKVGMMSFAHMHAFSYAKALQQLPNVELTAIFDDDMDRGEKVADEFSARYVSDQDEFLSLDIDAVIICSENNRHKEMVLNAAKAKKHILCEKPIATNVADAKEMIQVCKEEDVILQIAYPVRFSSSMWELKEKLDRGEVGEIIAFRTTNRGQNPGGWFIDENQSGGGAVLDHTVHMVDIMRWYLEEEIVEVEAIIDSYFQNIEIDDAGLLTFEFESGVIATHDASWSRFEEYPTWGDATIEVIGTEGTLYADAFQEHFRNYKSNKKSLEFIPFGYNMDFGLIRNFVNCVQEGNDPFITGYDGLKSLEVSLAAYESQRKNKPITL